MAGGFLFSLLLAAAAPAQDCQSLFEDLFDERDPATLPGAVDGGALDGPAGLLALRRERGEAPLVIVGGDFSGADLRGAALGGTCFVGSQLSGSDWRGAEASGAAFIGSELTGSDLRGARLERLLIRNSVMDDVDARRAVLAGGRLDGGWFTGSITRFRLDEADLTGFRFDCGYTIEDGCPIDGGEEQISLRGADLSGASLPTYPADLAGARIDGTRAGIFRLAELAAANLAGDVVAVGGDVAVALSPDEYRRLLPRLRAAGPPAASPECAGAESSFQAALCEEELEMRRGEAAARAGPPPWARPGARALFVDGLSHFDSAIRGDPLFERLLPAIVAGSASMVAARVREDGSIDARGLALGGNAHSCSLDGDALVRDAATGWYSGPQEPWEEDPPEWRGRPMPVLLLWEDRAFVYRSGRFDTDGSDPRHSDYASCGMRASFLPMRLAPVSAEQVERHFADIGAYEGDP